MTAVDPTVDMATTTTPIMMFDPDQVVLRIDSIGPINGTEFVLADLPEFVVTADGRVIIRGFQVTTVSNPALPPLMVIQLSQDGVARVLAAADEAGLFDPLDHYGNPGVYEAPITLFELSTRERSTTARVLGLGHREASPDKGFPPAVRMTEEQREARRRLVTFMSRLGDLEAWLGDDVIGTTPYPIDTLAVWLAPAPDAFGGGFFHGVEAKPRILEWPLAAADGVKATATYRCVLVEGDDLATLLPLAEQANRSTRWLIGDVRHQAVLRPVLPGEVGCDVPNWPRSVA